MLLWSNWHLSVIKCGMLSRVGLISKWKSHWIYYNLRVYDFLKQVQFSYMKTYQVFLNVANNPEIVNTSSSIARTRNCSTRKNRNSSSFFRWFIRLFVLSFVLSVFRSFFLSITRNSKTVGCIRTFYICNKCSTIGDLPFLV